MKKFKKQCPKCGSTNVLEFMDFEYDPEEKELRVEYMCEDCDAGWYAYYPFDIELMKPAHIETIEFDDEDDVPEDLEDEPEEKEDTCCCNECTCKEVPTKEYTYDLTKATSGAVKSVTLTINL